MPKTRRQEDDEYAVNYRRRVRAGHDGWLSGSKTGGVGVQAARTALQAVSV